VIGVGLFISSLATTQQQGILGAFVFMVPAILLSGFATGRLVCTIWDRISEPTDWTVCCQL